MTAEQIGRLKADKDRRKLRKPRVEPHRGADPDDRGSDRQPDQRRPDEEQLLTVALARAALGGTVGEDEAARNQPVNEDTRAIADRRRRHRRQPGVEQHQEQPRVAAERETAREQIVQPADLAAANRRDQGPEGAHHRRDAPRAVQAALSMRDGTSRTDASAACSPSLPLS